MPYISKAQQKKRNKAATKINALFRGIKPRRVHLKKMRHRGIIQQDFYSNSKFRNSSYMRPSPAPRAPRPSAVGYSPAPRHITRAMRVAMFKRRAAADYRHFETTGKRRNIYRGGAFYQ